MLLRLKIIKYLKQNFFNLLCCVTVGPTAPTGTTSGTQAHPIPESPQWKAYRNKFSSPNV